MVDAKQYTDFTEGVYVNTVGFVCLADFHLVFSNKTTSEFFFSCVMETRTSGHEHESWLWSAV